MPAWMHITRKQCARYARIKLNTTRSHFDTISVTRVSRVVQSESVTSCAATGTERHTSLSQTIISACTLLASTCDISRQLCWHGHTAFDHAPRATLRTVHQLYGTSASSSATIANRYIPKLLAPLLLAPVLDCNRRRNYHIGTRKYMDRNCSFILF